MNEQIRSALEANTAPMSHMVSNESTVVTPHPLKLYRDLVSYIAAIQQSNELTFVDPSSRQD